MSTKGLNFTRLVRELSFLKSDIEYHRAEHTVRRALFYDDLEKFIEETEFVFSEEKTVQKMKNVYKPKEKSMIVEKNTDLYSQNKEMYRKIAKKTHPDIHHDSDKTIMFKKASRAMQDGDWYALHELSEALGIKVEEYTPMHLEWLKMEIQKSRAIIKGIIGTFEWIYSDPNSNKQLVLTNYCKITCNKK
tara:strand:- start:1841 stop:2410 length:570 start_codon:yes stop_codon:yes gene_type:complete